MQRYKCRRSGESPLVFTGTILAHADNEIVNNNEASRWFDLTIYRTEAGKLVASMAYHSRWMGEVEVNAAAIFPADSTAEDFYIFFDSHGNAVIHGYGAIPGSGGIPVVDDKHERMLARVEASYKELVSDVLDSFGEPVDGDGEPVTPELETALVMASDAYTDASSSEFDSKVDEIAAAGDNHDAFAALENADPKLWAWVLTQRSAYENGKLSPHKRKLLDDLPGWDDFVAVK